MSTDVYIKTILNSGYTSTAYYIYIYFILSNAACSIGPHLNMNFLYHNCMSGFMTLSLLDHIYE